MELSFGCYSIGVKFCVADPQQGDLTGAKGVPKVPKNKNILKILFILSKVFF
ncbi:MAG: hypothetical protein V3S16_10540 [Candidatus Desulfatibia sp.]|uniref:hypothetical protein n=1 Tax=Candidatus Desulfatibia sp. TaxID=3101189 RepID=UPI002F32CD45